MRPGLLAVLVAALAVGCTCSGEPAAPTPAPPAGVGKTKGYGLDVKPTGTKQRRGRLVRIAVDPSDPEKLRATLDPLLEVRSGHAGDWTDLGCAEATWYDTPGGHLRARGYGLRHLSLHAGGCDVAESAGTEVSLGFEGEALAAGTASKAMMDAPGAKYTVFVLDVQDVDGSGTTASTSATATKRTKATKGRPRGADPAGAPKLFPSLKDLLPADQKLQVACDRHARETRWRWVEPGKDDPGQPTLVVWTDTNGSGPTGAELDLRAPPGEDEVFDAMVKALGADLAEVGMLAPTRVDDTAWATTCP